MKWETGKLIIAGGRDITDVTHLLTAIEKANIDLDSIEEVVCGEAKGVDTMGKMWATMLDIPIIFFPADWNRYGQGAGLRRNLQMAEYADSLLAIWDGWSTGTANMINQATENGLETYVHRI